jgi:hypothetical protein
MASNKLEKHRNPGKTLFFLDQGNHPWFTFLKFGTSSVRYFCTRFEDEIRLDFERRVTQTRNCTVSRIDTALPSLEAILVC